MKTKIISAILFFICHVQIYAQINPDKGFDLVKTEPEAGLIWGIYELGNNGWVVFTGRENTYNTKKIGLKMTLYGIDNLLKWTVAIDREATENMGSSVVITGNNKIFHIEFISKGMAVRKWKEIKITAIDVKGKTQTQTLVELEKLSMPTIKMFADDNNIYMLHCNNNDNPSKIEYFLRTIKTSDWSSNLIKLPLPLITEKTKYGFWIFADWHNGLLYFYSKGVQTNIMAKKQDITYDFIAFESNGNEKKKFTIQTGLDAGKFISPSEPPLSLQFPPNNKFIFLKKTQTSGGNYVVVKLFYAPYYGSFGDIYFDAANSSIYFFGLYNTNKMYDMGKSADMSQKYEVEYEGMFLQKYGMDGIKQYSTYNPIANLPSFIDKKGKVSSANYIQYNKIKLLKYNPEQKEFLLSLIIRYFDHREVGYDVFGSIVFAFKYDTEKGILVKQSSNESKNGNIGVENYQGGKYYPETIADKFDIKSDLMSSIVSKEYKAIIELSNYYKDPKYDIQLYQGIHSAFINLSFPEEKKEKYYIIPAQ